MNPPSRDCPDIGTWRAWLDRERVASGSGEEEGHLNTCPACQRLVGELRNDAADVQDLLSLLAPTHLPTAAEVAVARERLDWRLARRERPSPPIRLRPLEPIPMLFNRLTTPWRVAGGAIAAAVVLALVIAFTPEGNSVAVAFLAQFRSQEVTGIYVTPQSQAEITKALSALGSLGKVDAPGVPGEGRPATAARAAESQVKMGVSLAEAAQTIGLPKMLTPDPATLPAGVDKTPTVRVMPGQELKFTFDKKKAQAYFQSTGHANVNLPDKFDGATLVVSIPPAAILEYGSTQPNKTELIIGEAGEVDVSTQGNVSLEEMRDFLLGLPGLPPTVVNDLKGIKDWSSTLPIPVPIDKATWQSATINGSQGLVLWDNSGVGSAAIWNSNGHLFGVAGSLKATDLTNIANSLAAR